jgi:hypothetical protein
MSEISKAEPQSREALPKSRAVDHTLWPYGVCAFLLLVVLTSAILAPSYWNYSYRVQYLEHHLRLGPMTNSPAFGALTNSTASPMTAVTFSKSDNFNIPDAPLKTADIYETYGQLITMLLGFVAAVGVFFGYFAKKSLRELTEDVRQDVERQSAANKDQFAVLRAAVKDAIENTKAVEERLGEREAELKKLIAETQQILTTLNEARRTYDDTSHVRTTARMTATVDQQLENELQ